MPSAAASLSCDPGRARLWLPPARLAGCVRAAMLRDTRGSGLQGDGLLSYFPATPLVSLTWWFEGEGHWLDAPGFLPAQALAPGCTLWLSGPYTGPTIMRSQGEGQALQLLFQSDAAHALLGVPVASLVNRTVPAWPHLPEIWRRWTDAVRAAPGDEARLQCIEDFLTGQWADHERPALRRYRDWVEHLALRAASTAVGRSLRQAERRIKSWSGLPMRELRSLARAEDAFLNSAGLPGPLPWADVAANHGYADQSHLCREVRRVTGFTPTEVERRLHHDPAFWAYRLWL